MMNRHLYSTSEKCNGNDNNDNCGYFNSRSKTGALYFLQLQPLKPSWQHLTLNSNESSHFLPLTASGRQSCRTMQKDNQTPVMVLTSGRGQGLWLEGARQGQPIG